MNFLKKIFGSSSESKPLTQIVNEQKVIGLIYATVVFSHGWNDPSEIMPKQTSIILDVIISEDEIEEKLNYWNKLYYNQITQHYSINEEQLDSISEIINVPKEKYRELYAFWPKDINQDVYEKLYNELELKFVQYKPIASETNGKYLIKVNENFWDIKTHNSTILVDIINTYERDIKDFELIHQTYKSAMHYGVILMNRLCTERSPENLYYYEQEIKKQSQLQSLKSYDFNSYNSIEEEYKRILDQQGDDVGKMVSIIESMKIKPFEIIKINDDD
jgi:hypothetical protein